MSNFGSLFGGGLKPKFQEFTSSGTFTPSAGLLAQGGVVTIHLYGAGGAGGYGGYSSLMGTGGGGGGAGEYKCVQLTLTAGAITVTLGTGGTATNYYSEGNSGGNSTFGALLTALGGKGGKFGLGMATSSPNIGAAGGSGSPSGGIGISGGGGCGGSAYIIGLGGAGGVSGTTGVTGGTGGIASGGGGGGGSNFNNTYAPGGPGGNGYCRVEWWE